MAHFHVLRFDGEIDIADRQRLGCELSVIERFEPESIVILDLSDVKYVDTTLLNALIRIRNRSFADRSDGSIRLVARPSNNVRKLLEITRFADIFPTFDTLGDARRGIVFTSSRARSRP